MWFWQNTFKREWGGSSKLYRETELHGDCGFVCHDVLNYIPVRIQRFLKISLNCPFGTFKTCVMFANDITQKVGMYR